MASPKILRGQFYALAAMAAWSTNYVLGRALRDEISPATLSAFRALVAGIPLVLWLLATRGWPRVPRPVAGRLMVLGFFGVFASPYQTYLALHFSLATNVTILTAASPIVTAVMAVAAGVTPFSRSLFAGLGISTAGAALITALGASGGVAVHMDPGALLVIGSMITWAFYNIGVQRLSGDLPPLAITGGAMLTGFLFLLGALGAERPPHLMLEVRTHLPVLFYLAIVPSAVGYILWNAAVRDIGAGHAMIFNNTLPIFGMLLGGLMLHEPITVVQLLASAFIITGILLAMHTVAPADRPIRRDANARLTTGRRSGSVQLLKRSCCSTHAERPRDDARAPKGFMR